MIPECLRLVDLARADMSSFSMHLADSVVLTRDGKLLMQQRPLNWGSSAGCLTLFGGHVEPGETPLQGLVRELKEELGAGVGPAEVVFIGAITEDWTQHKELVHVHFWHDRQGAITGCYEAEPRHYDRLEEALAHPKIMDYARWALLECRSRGLLGKAGGVIGNGLSFSSPKERQMGFLNRGAALLERAQQGRIKKFHEKWRA